MLSAAFRQYRAERWLLNGRFNSTTSAMDGMEPIELSDDEREDDRKDGEREIDETDELSNKSPQPHAGPGVAMLCWPPGGFKS